MSKPVGLFGEKGMVARGVDIISRTVVRSLFQGEDWRVEYRERSIEPSNALYQSGLDINRGRCAFGDVMGESVVLW